MQIHGTELIEPVAFVFPGGGAACAYQVGVLKALSERGIRPDLLVGVSAGGLNAALFAWQNTRAGLERIDELWRAIRRRDLLRLHPARLALAGVGRRPSFIDNRHGRLFLRRHFGDRHIEDAPIRLAIVATDLATGTATALTSGDVTSAVLASTAFPGVYPPVELGERTFIDGGVVADMPLDLCVDLGAKSVVVIQVPDLERNQPVPRRAIDILLRASTFGVEAHGRAVLRRPPPELEAVIEIPAQQSTVTTFAIGAAGVIIDSGHEATARWLDEV